ncbi:adenine-specific DNA-methyltransferase [Luteibacter jiangsuensis]|uniref:site-specific DNA-methyltransferase (adenine-specific) n=1 Tax=Luteibacter jiangsuensis TaxID=637577 RepID=A0ABT9SZP6_9GAMM|nr:DNA adenine methylase [Luteibacter jiangsuensis]MDQ0010472.1 adenine-specific DNA-methyltransferase [Luteibacter jiangsuensis]
MSAAGLLSAVRLEEAPPTEGIKYAGSKLKLLPHILEMVKRVSPTTVLDGFSGSTRVSQALARSGYTVHSNDRSVWSETLASAYLKHDRPMSYYRELIAHLNGLAPVDGWFTENYGGSVSSGGSLGFDGLKKPWQIHNTRKLDAIREEIDRLSISEVDRCVLLSALMLALDAVDNTLGHHVSYLNDWSPRSYKALDLKLPRLMPVDGTHTVTRMDIFDLLPDVEVDVAYLDPPYGSNNEKMPPSRVRYSAYYHLWTTVCLNDRPETFGKAKRRVDSSDIAGSSVFEDFRRGSSGRFLALEAIHRTLKEVRARNIILSYSSGGRATAQELRDVINDIGELVEVEEIDYRRNVMSTMRWTNDWSRAAETPNKEFLFLIEKKG